MNPCWILTYSKTGSTYLCRLLSSTGLFVPEFREYYYTPNGQKPPETPPDYNKLLYSQYSRHKQLIMPILHRPGVRFIFLRRRDIIASAVSSYFQSQTRCNNIQDPKRLEKYQSFRLKYNKEKLTKTYLRKSWEYHFWNDFAIKQGEAGIEVYYEDVVADTEGQIARIMSHIGVTQPWKIDYGFESMTLKLEHPQKDRFTKRLRKNLLADGYIA